MCSLKAQSLQQKFQNDHQQRKTHADAVRLKAKEQQVQQQSSGNTMNPLPVGQSQQGSQQNVTTKPSSGEMRKPQRPVTSSKG